MIKGFFNKPYVCYTYCGEMALEIAFSAIDIKYKKVLVPYNACYRVLISVLRCGGIPIIVKPENDIFITPSDIEKVLVQHKDLYAILVVYQYGITIDIKTISQICKNKVHIIEDVAQGCLNSQIGKYSEFVVSSFGASKPMSLGLGGIVSGDKDIIESFVDNNNKVSRNSSTLMLPYCLPKNISIKEKKLMKSYFHNVKIQKSMAKKLYYKLSASNLKFSCFEKITDGTWHRFPIWTTNDTDYEMLLNYLNKNNIKYELPYKHNLQELPILKNYKYFFIDNNTSSKTKNIILLKTRLNKKEINL